MNSQLLILYKQYEIFLIEAMRGHMKRRSSCLIETRSPGLEKLHSIRRIILTNIFLQIQLLIHMGWEKQRSLILKLNESNESEINFNQEVKSINFLKFNLDINSIDQLLMDMDKMMMIASIRFKRTDEPNLEHEFHQ